MDTETYCPLCGARAFLTTFVREGDDCGLEEMPVLVCEECPWDSWWREEREVSHE